MIYVGDLIEEIHPDVTLHWHYGNRLAHFEIRSDHRDAFDAWAKRVSEVTKSWSREHPYLVIHDVSKSMLTPYARQKAVEVAELANQLPRGRYAVVVAPNLLGKAIALFVNRDISRKASNLDGHCFINIDQALGWLEECL